jgi:hypothetical protein
MTPGTVLPQSGPISRQIVSEHFAEKYGTSMTERETQAKLAELERLLNDPLVRMDAHRVWQLLSELRPPGPHPAAG